MGLTCILVGTSYFCTTLPDIMARLVGWLGVGFFGLGFYVIPMRFFRTGPHVVIDEDGIHDLRSNVGVIRWEDIRSMSIGSVSSSRFLCVELHDPEVYLSRRPRWQRPLAAANEALGFTALTIGFAGLSPGLDEAWAYLQQQARNREAGGTGGAEPRT